MLFWAIITATFLFPANGLKLMEIYPNKNMTEYCFPENTTIVEFKCNNTMYYVSGGNHMCNHSICNMSFEFVYCGDVLCDYELFAKNANNNYTRNNTNLQLFANTTTCMLDFTLNFFIKIEDMESSNMTNMVTNNSDTTQAVETMSNTTAESPTDSGNAKLCGSILLIAAIIILM